MAVSSKAISLLSRQDLEEKFIEVSEENQLLKKHAKAQEEKMKKLATKLLKLTSDERRELSLKRKLEKKSSGHGSRTDELEDMVFELQDKVRELEKQKANLMGRVTILRQQLESRGKRHTPYDKVQPKVNCGLLRTKKKSFSTEDIPSVKGQNVSTQVSPVPRYGRSLLEDARKDNQELEDLVVMLKREVGGLQEEIEHKKEQAKLSDLKHEEEVLQLRQQIQLVKNSSQRVNLEEDVEKIRLQRELRLKTVSIQSMETQYNALEKNFMAMKNSHNELMDEVKLLNTQLTQERVHSSDLNNLLHSAKIESQNITELQHAVSDLKVERDILKLSNDRLMKSALNAPASMHSSINQTPPLPSSFQLTNKLLEERLKEAEAKLKRETDSHSNIVFQLQTEIKSKEGVEQRLNQLQLQRDQLESEYQLMKDRLTQYCQGSSIDWKTIEEAISQYKTKPSVTAKVSIETTPAMTCTGRCLNEIKELKLALSEKTNELNKSNRLLSLQNTISQDYQKENEALRSEIKQTIEEYDKKLEEQSQLINIKTTRIKNLESQLKNIKYSPQKSTNEKQQSSATSVSEGINDSLIELSPGQNLLQVHLDYLDLSSDSIRHFQSSSPPSLFVCLLLNDYKTQVTPVECSFSPAFQFTANYVINMNNEVLQQLNTGSIGVELHQAFGMKYELLGRTTLPLKPLLSTDDNTYHQKVSMKGAGKLSNVSQAAFLSYWMKLKLPFASQKQSVNVSQPLHTGSGVHDNEIVITIIKCVNLPVSSQGHVPSAYAVYQFYTFPDHDTPVQQSTLSPEFNDTQVYGVLENQQMMQYLKQQDLMMFVFDDNDPDDNNYVGVTKVPLFRLANGENIKGTYPLYSSSGAISGHISLSIKWSAPLNSKHHHHSNHPSIPLHVKTSPTGKEALPLDKSTAHSSNDGSKLSSTEQSLDQKPTSKDSPRVSPVLTISDLTSPTSTTEEERATEDRSSNTMNGNYNRARQDKGEKEIKDDIYDSLTLSEDITEELLSQEDEELTSITDEDTLFEDTNVSSAMYQSQPSVKLLAESEEDDDSTIIGGSLDLSLGKEDEDIRRSPSPPPHPPSHSTPPPHPPSHGTPPLHPPSHSTPSPHQPSLGTPPRITPSPPPHPPSPTTPSPTPLHTGDHNRNISKTIRKLDKNDDFEVRFSLTVLSFTLEEGYGGLKSLQNTSAQVFIEYQLLDIDESELETPTSLPFPQPGQTAVFNFTKEFIINKNKSPTTAQLLEAMVNSKVPVEQRVPFTVVSDPQDSDSETECQEIGVAELDLKEVINEGKNQAVEDIDVYGVDTDIADNGVIGYLTISLDGLDGLRELIIDK